MASPDNSTESLGSSTPAAMSGTSSPGYMRATTSSSAKKRPEDYVCNYRYCSLHHASSPPVKEFLSTKRQLFNKRLDKKLRDDVIHTTSATKNDQSREMVYTETHTAQLVNYTREEDDDGLEFLITSCVKPGNDSDQTSVRDYDWKLAEAPSNKSQPTEKQEVSIKDVQEQVVEERGATPVNLKKDPADPIPLPGKAKQNGDTFFESSQLSSKLPDSMNLKLNRLVTYSMNLANDKVPQDNCKCNTPKEYTLIEEELQGEDPFSITVEPSHAISPSSDTHRVSTNIKCRDEQGILPEEMDVSSKRLVRQSHLATKTKISSTEGMDDEYQSAQNRTFLDREKYTRLWNLIFQHLKTDFAEKMEMQLSDEMDTESNTSYCSEISPGIIHDKGMDRCHEDEAIKLVQEAINELLVLPEHAGDNQSSSACITSEQGVGHQVLNNGETPMDLITALEDDKTSPREKLSTIYRKLSKVAICERFIKAINKMKDLKQRPPQELFHIAHPEAEGAPLLSQTTTAENKSWQEWMLDHALQQVVAKLAPAQKKRVTLLVQAFEIVGSQWKPTTGQTSKPEIL